MVDNLKSAVIKRIVPAGGIMDISFEDRLGGVSTAG